MAGKCRCPPKRRVPRSRRSGAFPDAIGGTGFRRVGAAESGQQGDDFAVYVYPSVFGSFDLAVIARAERGQHVPSLPDGFPAYAGYTVYVKHDRIKEIAPVDSRLVEAAHRSLRDGFPTGKVVRESLDEWGFNTNDRVERKPSLESMAEVERWLS